MYAVILVVHLLVCLMLIAVILLQAGRGGGVADIFGGGTQSLLGTRASAFLTKATTACAAVFILTSLTLAILSAQQGQSLMERQRLRRAAAPRAAPAGSATKPVAPNRAPGQPSGQPAAPEPAPTTPPPDETTGP